MLIQRSLLHKLLSLRTLMLYSPALASPPRLIPPLGTRSLCYSHRKRLVPTSAAKPRQISIHTSSAALSNGSVPRPVSKVDPTVIEESSIDPLSTLTVLGKKLEQIGIEISPCTPGQHNNLFCPRCNGGSSAEKSFSVSVTADGNMALFTCFRATCGWQGSIKAFADKSTYEKMVHAPKAKKIRIIKEESLELEPLCNELLAYFAERMISRDTLERNTVAQRRYGGQIAIAFPYRRNRVLVSCKYRDINKNFWQEADAEKIFYGLDDIKDAKEIIIVEGEMDKLAMEEAGFRNCVSVPDGAPPAVSDKKLPSQEQDIKYQYLWNCKQYLEKVSRIILATDGDAPGQALAEELARRIGRERCWQVKWPKKNDVGDFKDANEVLMYMGPDKLKEVIDNAELISPYKLLRGTC